MSEHLGNSEKLKYPKATDDFFRHVNGEWLETTPIPPGETRWGSYNLIRDITTDKLVNISSELVSSGQIYPIGSPEQQVADFYRSSIDMEARDNLGIEPLRPLINQIESIQAPEDILPVVASLRRNGISTLFSMYVEEDDKISGQNALYFHQGGLGLPSKSYYLDNSARNIEIRYQYNKYQNILLQISGMSAEEAEVAADDSYQIEKALATSSRSPAESRIADANYHKIRVKDAKQQYPGIDWGTYLEAIGCPDQDSVIIGQPEFFHKVEEIIQIGDIDAIKNYLKFKLIKTYAPYLTSELDDVNFAFTGKVLNGIDQQKSLPKRTVNLYNGLAIMDAAGPLYCERYFDNESKIKLTQMVNDVKESFGDRLNQITWMSDETKQKTKAKLANIKFKMGYPDQWPDVSDLEIKTDSLALNIMRCSSYSFDRNIKSLEKPYDTSQWAMPPIMVNACSDLKREMTFPAAVLQAPFFDPNQDDAYNYGAIGGTMGHELTHFFDDEGCKYDLNGNLVNWWSQDDESRFDELTSKFSEYFSSLKFMDMNIDGDLTNGENIADVGGIKIAYYAYQKKLAREGGAGEIIDGLTPEQRFFVGWARKWKGKITQGAAANQIATDPHSPSEIRVNGVLAITPEFHTAFGVSEGDGMYVAPDNLPILW